MIYIPLRLGASSKRVEWVGGKLVFVHEKCYYVLFKMDRIKYQNLKTAFIGFNKIEHGLLQT